MFKVGRFVSSLVGWLVGWQDYTKTPELILMKLEWRMGMVQNRLTLTFSADPDKVMDPCAFFDIVK